MGKGRTMKLLELIKIRRGTSGLSENPDQTPTSYESSCSHLVNLSEQININMLIFNKTRYAELVLYFSETVKNKNLSIGHKIFFSMGDLRNKLKFNVDNGFLLYENNSRITKGCKKVI